MYDWCRENFGDTVEEFAQNAAPLIFAVFNRAVLNDFYGDLYYAMRAASNNNELATYIRRIANTIEDIDVEDIDSFKDCVNQVLQQLWQDPKVQETTRHIKESLF
ncbi:MAG: hypothetical protein QXT13_08075 [Pyrobaculum sp.]